MKKHKKRIAVFSISTQINYLADFTHYLLHSLKKNFHKIVLVTSDALCEAEKERLKADSYIIIESIKGQDTTRWKYIICNIRNARQFETIDEITILNDSFYGPFCPWQKIFKHMDEKGVDFWGLSAYSGLETPSLSVQNCRGFIQTYYVTFGRKLIHSAEFYDFWHSLPNLETPEMVQKKFEHIMTLHFQEHGYKWSVYSDTQDWQQSGSYIQEPFLLTAPFDMVSKKNLPIVSRYLFQIEQAELQNYQSGNQIPNMLHYIEKRGYPLELIYKDLIHYLNVYQIMEHAGLNLILGKTSCWRLSRKSVAIILYLYYSEQFMENLTLLKVLSPWIDIYIFTDSKDKKNNINHIAANIRLKNKISVSVVDSHGREWAALLIEGKKILRNYKYFCFLHDKKAHSFEYRTVGESFKQLLWENTIGTRKYVEEIIHTFESKPYIGVIVPPIVKHGFYFKHYGNFWTACYKNTVALANKIGISKKFLSECYPPISIGSAFWARTDSLQPLFEYEFSREDFPPEPLAIDGTLNHCLERIIPYVAQQEGYCTATARTWEYAQSNLSVYENMIRSTISLSSNIIDNFSSYSEFLDWLGGRKSI